MGYPMKSLDRKQLLIAVGILLALAGLVLGFILWPCPGRDNERFAAMSEAEFEKEVKEAIRRAGRIRVLQYDMYSGKGDTLLQSFTISRGDHLLEQLAESF